MKTTLMVSAGLVLAVLGAGCGKESDPPKNVGGAGDPKTPAVAAKSAAGTPQTKCPVMGGKIKKSAYADHAGKRVYFCCPGCDRTFKKDPAKYIKKLKDAGVTVARVPGT